MNAETEEMLKRRIFQLIQRAGVVVPGIGAKDGRGLSYACVAIYYEGRIVKAIDVGAKRPGDSHAELLVLAQTAAARVLGFENTAAAYPGRVIETFSDNFVVESVLRKHEILMHMAGKNTGALKLGNLVVGVSGFSKFHCENLAMECLKAFYAPRQLPKAFFKAVFEYGRNPYYGKMWG